MNSAKKIISQQEDTSKKSLKKGSAAKGNGRLGKASGPSPEDLKKIVISAFCIALILVLCIGVGIQQLSPKVVMTINHDKITMSDMMYPIYAKESKYLPYNAMYESYTGTSVWDYKYSGTDTNVSSQATNKDGLKQEIIDEETEYYILYKEAVKAGYKLTAAEEKKASKQASAALKGLSVSQKVQLGFTKGRIKKRFEKLAVADAYKLDNEKRLNKSVDTASVTKTVSKKDYREYDIQYYSFDLTQTDSKTNKTKMISSKEKSAAMKTLEAAHKKALTAKDFTTLLSKTEKTVTYSSDKFTEKDGWAKVSSKNLLKKVKAMKNGEISNIITDNKSGYCLFVKMINNNSSASYQSAVKTAITSAKNSKFNTWYSGLTKNYTIKTNATVWNDVTIGKVTTGIVTAKDLEKIKKASATATGAAATATATK